MTNDPAAVYAALLSERRQDAAGFDRNNARFAYARLAIAISAAVVVWLALSRGYSVLWVLVPVSAFVALMMAHERLLRRVQRLRRAKRFFERGLARLKGDWEGRGETGERYLDPAHPYAQDLDLFGKASLFELLVYRADAHWRRHVGAMAAGARSRPSRYGRGKPRWRNCAPGSTCASNWRCWRKTRARASIRFRWRNGAKRRRNWRAAVCAFRHGPSASFGIAGLAAGFVGMIASAGLVKMAPSAVVFGRDLFLLALAVNGIFYYRNRALMEPVVAAVDEAAHELRLLAEVLALLEKQSFHAPLLAELRASLDTEQRAAFACAWRGWGV